MNKKIKLCFYAFFLIGVLSGCVPNRENMYYSSQAQNIRNNHAGYTIFGNRYSTLKSSRNYEEQGIASWYGRKFHRRRTTSGERFNMYKLTAAHRTLPLSSYVMVTNLSNGRHVIVRINDRGPFVSNRLIDVSYAAAKKLGMVGHGTVRVNVKAVAHA